MSNQPTLSAPGLAVHVLLAFSEKSKPLTDSQFIQACEVISAAFLDMAEECRYRTRPKPSDKAKTLKA